MANYYVRLSCMTCNVKHTVNYKSDRASVEEAQKAVNSLDWIWDATEGGPVHLPCLGQGTVFLNVGIKV